MKDDIGGAIICKRIKDGGKFKGIFKGKFPLKYYGIVTPSDDPLAWCGTTTAVEQEKFCLPDTFVWFPESQWPTLQPDTMLPCKWHGTTDWVENEGWMRRPRHGYSSGRTVAILGRCYKCKLNVPPCPVVCTDYERTHRLQNGAWWHCTILANMRVPGFPLRVGERMPPRKK